MMKKIRKWCVVLLSFVMVVSLAVPALAASAEEGTVLNVRFAPNGNGVNSTDENPIVYTAYRIADVSVDAETGYYKYTPTPAFAGAGIDINAILGGAQANANLAACKQLLTAFGSYINANAGTIAEKGGNDILTAKTENTSIGANNTSTDGIAQFRNLTDGLYLVSTNASVWIGDTHYTPYPLLVAIPYVYDGVTNEYLTATVKFNIETPTPPYNPPPPAYPDTPAYPSTTTTPDTPAAPDTTATPDTLSAPNTPASPVTPPEFQDIPPESVPLAEPEVEILDMDVPLADMLEDIDEPEFEILDMDVPLSSLPQTGLLWWPVPVMAVVGIILVISGVLVKRKTVYDE